MEQQNSDPRILHACLLKSTTTLSNTNTTLITNYAKASSSQTSTLFRTYTQRIFTLIPNPTVITWTSLITALSLSSLSLLHFTTMLRTQTLPNQRTLSVLLKTCTHIRNFAFGRLVHCLAVKLGFCTQRFCGSSLVAFYYGIGLVGDAVKVFHEMPECERDGVCYSGAVNGLVKNGRWEEGLGVFREMVGVGVRSTVFSVSGAVRAAGGLAVLEGCRMVHGHALVTGLDRDCVVGSALVDGYGRAGVVEDARRVFDEGFCRMGVVGWNALMAGYAQQGDHKSVIEVFGRMKGEGFCPDEYSFLAVLSCLCNAGLDVETERWLSKMKVEYGLEPSLEHYTCLVRVLGRVGRLKDAEEVARTMHFKPDAAVWRSLLSSCVSNGAADMAWIMARRLWELDPQDDSAYVIAANVFGSVGRWDEFAEVRKMMKNRRVTKESGKSWIEVKGEVYVFLASDKRHERTPEIYAKLRELMEGIENLGYKPVCSEILHDVDEDKKKEALWYHSEKLAVAFGVLCKAAPSGKALRIVKNLRICRDCHEAFKYMSRMLEREIIVRDVNRYHRFLNGSCNCGDVW